MIRLLVSLNAALAPLDPAEPDVAAAIRAALAELPPEPSLDRLLAARERIWDRLASENDSPPLHGSHPDGEA